VRADERVPAYLIRLPASVKTVFLAETSTAAFHRFDHSGDQRIEYRGREYMSIGLGGAGKQRAGDLGTPLGIYFVTEQLDTSKLHEKYGVSAFPLDYPNGWDRRQERTGDGIWVHGVDRRGGVRPKKDTDGCIALPNDKLLGLESRFLPNVTPVVIARELIWVDHGQVVAVRAELEAVVFQWADSLQRGNLHAYLSLYDSDFRHWGMNKEEWTVLTVQTLGSRPITDVSISDMLLLGYPEEKELYLSRFRLGVTEGPNTIEVNKRLYWHRSESGALKIIAEDSG
jgi:murein L,D-transpeptidase YafK